MRPSNDMVPLTVDQAIEKCGFGLSQVINIAASSGIFFLELLSLVSDGILLPIIKCEWDLTSLQAMGYLMSTRIAFCFGGALGGALGDKIGRRLSIMTGLVFQITMTTISLNTFSMPLYIFFHAINKIAFGIIMPSAHAFALESCPASWRFLVKISFGYAGCFGGMFGAFVGQFYELYGWRYIQLLVTFPCYMAFLAFLFLDPSPRYLLVKGKQNQAEGVIKRILKRNCKANLDTFRLVEETDISETPGSYKDLFQPGLAQHSYKLMFIVIMKGIFVTTIYIALPYILGKPNDVKDLNDHPENCYSLNSKTNSKMLTAFLPSLLIQPALLLLAQHYGRGKTICMAMLTASLSLCLALPLSLGSASFALSIGIALGTIAAARSVIVLYTSELYPTTMRGVANGMIWVADSMGSLVAPFLAEYFILSAPKFFVFLTAIAMGASAFVAKSLGTETLNKPLPQSIFDMAANIQT